MERWEYTVADFTKLDSAVAELDKLGAKGWEAVGLVSTWGAGWGLVHPVVLLKRPLAKPATSRLSRTRSHVSAPSRVAQPVARRKPRRTAGRS